MKILTTEDQSINTDDIAIEEQQDFYYGVLDFTKPKYPDFMFKPLVFVDVFQDSGVKLEAEGFELMLPFKWSLLTYHGEMLEYISMEDICGHEVDAVCLNPLSSYRPEVTKVNLTMIYKTASFSKPTHNSKHLLVLPYDNKPSSPKCLIAGESTVKVPDRLDIGSIW